MWKHYYEDKEFIFLTYVSISWGISSKSSKVLWLASIVWFIFLFSRICSADSMNSVHPDVSFGISFICDKGGRCQNDTSFFVIYKKKSIKMKRKIKRNMVLNLQTTSADVSTILQLQICLQWHHPTIFGWFSFTKKCCSPNTTCLPCCRILVVDAAFTSKNLYISSIKIQEIKCMLLGSLQHWQRCL